MGKYRIDETIWSLRNVCAKERHFLLICHPHGLNEILTLQPGERRVLTQTGRQLKDVLVMTEEGWMRLGMFSLHPWMCCF